MFPYNYNNGYGGGYVNAYQAPQQTAQMPNNTYAYVNGLEGAKAFFVPSNGRVLLMDSDNPIFYMKTANAMGQTTIRTFKFEEVQEQNTPKNDYAKQADIAVLNARVSKIEELLTGGKKNESDKK